MYKLRAGGGFHIIKASSRFGSMIRCSARSFSGSYGFSPRRFNRPAAQYSGKSFGTRKAGELEMRLDTRKSMSTPASKTNKDRMDLDMVLLSCGNGSQSGNC